MSAVRFSRTYLRRCQMAPRGVSFAAIFSNACRQVYKSWTLGTNEQLLETRRSPRRRTARVLKEGLSVNPSEEYNVTDPIIRRAIITSQRADSASYRTLLFSPAVRLTGEDASDGPVDGWVDDVDGDWDDIIVPEPTPPERTDPERPAAQLVPDPGGLRSAGGVAGL